MSIYHLPSQKEKLTVFLETKSLIKYLLTNEKKLTQLLGYVDTKYFDFIRSPMTSDADPKILSSVTDFVLLSKEKNINVIQIQNKNKSQSLQLQEITLRYLMEDIQAIAGEIYDKDSVNPVEFNSVLMVFIHLTFIKYGIYSKNAFVFVTQNRTLLERREWMEKKFGKLNIMTVQESMVYMDLYAKSQHVYYLKPHYTINIDCWYWDSFRTKIPHYHVPTRENSESVHILEGFASRFKFLLLAVDEIGMQVYFPKDEDIMMPYHFNYFLSLSTGIFDNLAIETKSKYKIKFNGDHISSRISLSKGGEDFLDQVKVKNPALHKHIKNYGQFRKLIYGLREIAIHREGFRDMGYQDSAGFSLFLVINKETRDLVKFCGDKPSTYEKFTNWGIFDNEFFIFLEPYRFVKAAATELIKFCDRYLELMNFKRFIDTLSKRDQFRSDLESFNECRLGF